MLTALTWLFLLAGDAPLLEPPPSLTEARRLADALRYEEALLEYQRYLSLPQKPSRERAEALFDMGFLYWVLGDQASAFAKAEEALDLWPSLTLPPSAPSKQLSFLSQARSLRQVQVTLSEAPKEEIDEPETVRVKVEDAEQRVKKVFLRHALSLAGPFYAVEMTCESQKCHAQIPPPAGSGNYTAYYYVEGSDENGTTLATESSPFKPRKLSVVRPKPWHSQPWAWAGIGAAAIATGVVIYLLAPPLPGP